MCYLTSFRSLKIANLFTLPFCQYLIIGTKLVINGFIWSISISFVDSNFWFGSNICLGAHTTQACILQVSIILWVCMYANVWTQISIMTHNNVVKCLYNYFKTLFFKIDQWIKKLCHIAFYFICGGILTSFQEAKIIYIYIKKIPWPSHFSLIILFMI